MSLMGERQNTIARSGIDPKNPTTAVWGDLHDNKGHQECYHWPKRGKIQQLFDGPHRQQHETKIED
jgi:hypothetical protein